MTTPLSPQIYMRKADAALSTARLALNAGDGDSACNRAYYAMFDAAHAALFALGVEKIDAPFKTHNGLSSMFGLHLVQARYVAVEHGEALNAVQRLRQIADYSGDFVSLEDATRAMELAQAFIAAIKAVLVKISA